jgi:hypothetical protein
MWRLMMHEAPARTRALHRELAAAPPLTAGYAAGRSLHGAVVQHGAASPLPWAQSGRGFFFFLDMALLI